MRHEKDTLDGIFEGDDGRLSMTRLLCFLSFGPSSYVVVATQSENALGWYLGAYVLGYVGGKTTDIFMKPKGGQNALVTASKE